MREIMQSLKHMHCILPTVFDLLHYMVPLAWSDWGWMWPWRFWVCNNWHLSTLKALHPWVLLFKYQTCGGGLEGLATILLITVWGPLPNLVLSLTNELREEYIGSNLRAMGTQGRILCSTSFIYTCVASVISKLQLSSTCLPSARHKFEKFTQLPPWELWYYKAIIFILNNQGLLVNKAPNYFSNSKFEVILGLILPNPFFVSTTKSCGLK